jgi:predicted metal-dependent phosphoesterase TrpH
MLTWFNADLHIHTCLSPCADLTMSPRRIVAEALHNGLDIIAVTDHNSSGNCTAVMGAAEGTPLTVLPGMEVCTEEEVHVLALFESSASAAAMQAEVYKHITGANDPEVFGLQVIASECDEVEGIEERLLIGATGLSLEEVVDKVHDLGGLAIASHIDRERNGILGQLGFIPAQSKFDAVEVTHAVGTDEAERFFRQGPHFPMIRNSDAHEPARLGGETTWYLLGAPSLAEIRLALRREGGRRFRCSTES